MYNLSAMNDITTVAAAAADDTILRSHLYFSARMRFSYHYCPHFTGEDTEVQKFMSLYIDVQ